MSVRIGSMIFDAWRSLPLAENRWSDTVVFPLSVQDCLPPTDYASIIKAMLPPAEKLRRSLSVWVQVQDAPGQWFPQELARSFKGSALPVAVTTGEIPRAQDFSYMPWTDIRPSPPLPDADDLFPTELSPNELRCLRALARLETAYTAEVASLAGVGETNTRQALKDLAKNNLVKVLKGKKYPYWTILRGGISVVLRSWGVPPGVPMPKWKERHSGGIKKEFAKQGIDRVGRHLHTARLWPFWLRRSWPHAEIWAGWSEVTLGRWRRPDALAWGSLDGVETLFWLEVEKMHRSRDETKDLLFKRHNRALIYARSFPVHLVFVVLSQAWIHGAVIDGFQDLPNSTAVVFGEWTNYGSLPVPVWGRAVK